MVVVTREVTEVGDGPEEVVVGTEDITCEDEGVLYA